MALFLHEVRLVDRFVCPTPGSAAPCNRRAQVLPRHHVGHVPHVEVDLRICTAGTYVDRTTVNGYAGHTPDAPVMLGAQQRVAYLRGMEATRPWGSARWLAVAGAGAVGAVLAASLTALVAAAAYAVGLGAAASAPLLLVAAAAALAGAAVFGCAEWRGWDAFNQRLATLEQMSCAVTREMEGDGSYVLGAVDDEMLSRAMASEDWALQQAAMELSNPFEAEARATQREADGARRKAA